MASMKIIVWLSILFCVQQPSNSLSLTTEAPNSVTKAKDVIPEAIISGNASSPKASSDLEPKSEPEGIPGEGTEMTFKKRREGMKMSASEVIEHSRTGKGLAMSASDPYHTPFYDYPSGHGTHDEGSRSGHTSEYIGSAGQEGNESYDEDLGHEVTEHGKHDSGQLQEYSDSDGSSLSDSGYDNSYGGHFDEGVVGEKGHDSSLKDNVSKGHSNEGFKNVHKKLEYGFTETFGDDSEDSSFLSSYESFDDFFDAIRNGGDSSKFFDEHFTSDDYGKYEEEAKGSLHDDSELHSLDYEDDGHHEHLDIRKKHTSDHHYTPPVYVHKPKTQKYHSEYNRPEHHSEYHKPGHHSDYHAPNHHLEYHGPEEDSNYHNPEHDLEYLDPKDHSEYHSSGFEPHGPIYRTSASSSYNDNGFDIIRGDAGADPHAVEKEIDMMIKRGFGYDRNFN